MNSSKNSARPARWVASGIAIAAIVIAVAWALRTPQQETAGSEAAGPKTGGLVQFRMEQQWLIRLKLAVAEEAEVAAQIRSTGRVVPAPANRAIVAPPVGGIIQTGTMPQIGQQVTRGQRLAVLVQTPTAAEAAAIHIENMRVDAERRKLAQLEIEAQARLEEATHDLARSKRLYEKKAYSAKALEVDELNRTAAEAQLKAVQEQIKALQAAPPASSSLYEVQAPIAGTIVRVGKSSGERVGPGEAILEIVAMDTVWVEAPIFEKDLGGLGKNAEAIFSTPTFPDKEFRGRLVNLGAVIDEQTRAAAAVFEVSNRSGELRIGMQANVRIDSGAKTQAVLVPRESIVDNEGKQIVYVLRTGEEFERRDVVLGDEYGGKVAILTGVKAGERVVTQGAYQLKLQELRPADAGAHTHEV